MNKKDKAIELVDKYEGLVKYNTSLPHKEAMADQLANAKKAAIIAVEEIMNTLISLKLDIFSIGIYCQYTDKKITYWLQVKEEIERYE